MYAKSAIAVAALAGSAQAFNSHRHLHQGDRRAMDVDWVTVYQTVYVHAGQAAPPAKTSFAPNQAPVVTSHIAVPTTQAAPPPPPAAAAAAIPEDPLSKIIGSDQPSATPTPSTGDKPGSKRGVAYNDGLLANLFGTSCETCRWAYNWNANPGTLSSKSMTYIPMLWGDIPVHTTNWDSDAQKALDNGAKHMFSFNECDNAGQANMSPAAAATAHRKYMNKYAGKAQIGAPSITNSGNAGEGISWLKSFMSECESQGGCQVDFCNVHWYSESQYASTLFDHLEAAHKACGNKPIWLTEFAPLDKENAGSFLKEVIPKLESLDYLDAYSYFMVAPDNLLSGSSLLSALGNVYATLAGKS